MKLKICGMKQPQNILEVGSLLPDYMGFIFWEKSARYFDGIMPELPKSIKKTGVFVNEKISVILEKTEKYNLQAIQLHGQESADFCLELKTKLDAPIEIIKVFSADGNFDFNVLKPFEAVCDFFLFDTKGKLPGGNGTTFDWSVLENYPSTKPFFLSGGIGIEEIKILVETLHCNVSKDQNVSIDSNVSIDHKVSENQNVSKDHNISPQGNAFPKKLPIYAIDINSKFEIEPGLKNVQLCRDVALQRLNRNV